MRVNLFATDRVFDFEKRGYCYLYCEGSIDKIVTQKHTQRNTYCTHSSFLLVSGPGFRTKTI